MKTLTGKRKRIFKQSVNISRGVYKHIYPEIFKNKHRVELNLSMSKDYHKSYTYSRVEQTLHRKGYEIVDYVGGYATKDAGKNKVKIGKLLKKCRVLLPQFRDCPYRQKIKVVLSRHPYDIACCSYGQSWDSCLDFDDGDYKENLINTLHYNNALIAYAVGNSGKPLGRVFIVPYYNEDTGLQRLYVACKAYGLMPIEHLENIQAWLDKNYNIPFVDCKLDDDDAYEFLMMSTPYDDDFDCAYQVKNPNIFENRLRIRKTIMKSNSNILELLEEHDIHKVSDLSDKSVKILKSELTKYIDWMHPIDDDRKRKSRNESAYLFISNITVDNSDYDEYIHILKRYGLKIMVNEELDKYVQREKYSVDHLRDYINILDNPADWKHGKKWLDALVETGDIEEHSQTYKEFGEKILVRNN